MCSFCEGGVVDPEFPLVQGQTCGTVKDAVAMMDATNPNCAMAKQAEALCCPAAVDPAAPDTTAGAPEEVTTDAPPAPTPSTYDEPPSPTPPSPTPPSPTPVTTMGAPSGAMTMETTLAAFAVAGAMMLV